MKKSLLWLLIALVSISIITTFSLAGCKKAAAPTEEAAAPTEEAAAPTEEAAKEAVTIKMLVMAGPQSFVLDKYAGAYEEKTGVKVEYDTVPFQEIFEKMMAERIAETKTYDMFQYYAWWKGDLIASDILKDVTSFIEKNGDQDLYDDIVPFYKWQGLSFGDKIYGVPWDGDMMAFYYRKDLYEDQEIKDLFMDEYGRELTVPSTWDELIETSKFFNEHKFKTTDYRTGEEYQVNNGISIWCARPGLHWIWGDIFLSQGGEWFTEDGVPGINTEAGIYAVETVKELIKYAPEGVLNYGFTENDQALTSGLVAQSIDWVDIWAEHTTDRSRIAHAKGTPCPLGIAEVPGGKPMVGGWYAGVYSLSDHAEEAYKFLVYLARPEQSVWSVTDKSNTGINPFLVNGHFKNPEVRESEAFDYPEALDILLECANSAGTSLLIPHGVEYTEIFEAEIAKAIVGQISAKEALDNAAEQWTELNSKYFGQATLPAELIDQTRRPANL
jgi:multiple sugar transport system substrate-binding protein